MMVPKVVEKDLLQEAYRDHVARLRSAYAAALENAGYAAVVLHSGSLRLRSEFDDQFWPLRVVPHFAHWVPLEWPDCALVVTTGAQPRILVYRDRSFWERAPEPDWAHFAGEFEVVEIADPAAARAEIAASPGASGRIALVAEDRRRAAAWGFEDATVNPPELVRALDALRTRKTPYEVACLAEANRRAARGHRAVVDAFRNGDPSELQLHLLFLSATRQDDLETPYKNIVAMGKSAAILHHVRYGREAPRGARSLLLDAGATCYGYASDVTRTYVDEGSVGAGLFGDLIEQMERLQQRMCARIRVGLPYEALHDQAHRDLAVVLRELGIVRLSEEELVSTGVTRRFFPHGLGHALGIQTHDVGCLVAPPRPENPWLRNTSEIAVDQVFTIEPGIYFIDSLLDALASEPAAAAVDWKLVDALRPFGGIRIEDNLVVLAPAIDGPTARNLTREALGQRDSS